MSYDDSMLGRMSSKSQSATVDGVESVALTTGCGGYEYSYDGNGAPPRALSSYGHGPAENNLSYDVNGNMTSHISDGNLTTAFTKNMYWNTNNLMRGIKVDDYMIQHYMYDAEGQRVLKAKGDITTAGTNGNNTTSAVLNPYTIYPSGHITISASGRYTKHYYSGSERIVSRLSGVYNDFLSSEDLSVKKAIQKDGELALLQSDLGVNNLTAPTPLPPTYDDDCIDQYTDIESEDYKQCRCEQNPTLCPENVFYFFHSDQLGSSSVLTGFDGNPYQFLVYLPWGEVLGEQKAAQFSTPYQFNGKELDSETGLYNYGARYYDPSLSVWLGVDPLADKFYSWSPYHYATNNPINIIDFDGRDTLGPVGKKLDQLTSNTRDNIGKVGTKIENIGNKVNEFFNGERGGYYYERYGGKGENSGPLGDETTEHMDPPVGKGAGYGAVEGKGVPSSNAEGYASFIESGVPKEELSGSLGEPTGVIYTPSVAKTEDTVSYFRKFPSGDLDTVNVKFTREGYLKKLKLTTLDKDAIVKNPKR